MKLKKLAPFIKEIEKHKSAIAGHRDALRGMLNELQEICDNCDEAELDLEKVIDTLSQYL